MLALLLWWYEDLFFIPEAWVWTVPIIGLISFFTWLSASIASLWPFLYREIRSYWHKKQEKKYLISLLPRLSANEAKELWAAIQSKSDTLTHRPNNTTLASLVSKGFVKMAGEKRQNHNVSFIINDTAWEVINENSRIIQQKVTKNTVPEVEIVKE